MTIPIRNHLLDIIKLKENYTDKELEKALTKDGTVITEGKFNKVLLDLEIMGLINVSWVTKENRRIEAVTEKIEEDEYEEQIKETLKDYEKVEKLTGVSQNLSIRMKQSILSLDENTDRKFISDFVDNEFLALDARAYRKYVDSITPDIELKFDYTSQTGNQHKLDVPLGIEFFWPAAGE